MSAEFYEDESMTKDELEINSRQAFSKLLPLLKKHWTGFTFCLLLLTCATALSLYWPILLKKAIDVNIANDDFRGLIYTALLIGGIQCATIAFQYIQRIWLEIIGQDIMVKLKTMLYDHVLSLKVSFFDKNPVGRADGAGLRMIPKPCGCYLPIHSC